MEINRKREEISYYCSQNKLSFKSQNYKTISPAFREAHVTQVSNVNPQYIAKISY